MGFIIHKTVKHDALLGIWDMHEDVDYFLSQVTLTESEWKIFKKFRSSLRQRQWLVYRMLIKKLLKLDRIVNISYDSRGRPSIVDHHYRISVTHSYNYVGVLIHGSRLVGIDIERINSKIRKVTRKYINKEERLQLGPHPSVEEYNLIWSAKEALYKVHGTSRPHFKDQLHILPFDKPGKKGNITGEIKEKKKIEQFELHYERIKDFFLVYVIDEKEIKP